MMATITTEPPHKFNPEPKHLQLGGNALCLECGLLEAAPAHVRSLQGEVDALSEQLAANHEKLTRPNEKHFRIEKRSDTDTLYWNESTDARFVSSSGWVKEVGRATIYTEAERQGFLDREGTGEADKFPAGGVWVRLEAKDTPPQVPAKCPDCFCVHAVGEPCYAMVPLPDLGKQPIPETDLIEIAKADVVNRARLWAAAAYGTDTVAFRLATENLYAAVTLLESREQMKEQTA